MVKKQQNEFEESLCKLETSITGIILLYFADCDWLPGAVWWVSHVPLHPGHTHAALPVCPPL